MIFHSDPLCAVFVLLLFFCIFLFSFGGGGGGGRKKKKTQCKSQRKLRLEIFGICSITERIQPGAFSSAAIIIPCFNPPVSLFSPRYLVPVYQLSLYSSLILYLLYLSASHAPLSLFLYLSISICIRYKSPANPSLHPLL